MAWYERVAEYIEDFVTDVIETVRSIAEYIYNHLIFTSQPENTEQLHNEEYTLTETDEKYIRESRKVLHEVLGKDPTRSLLAMEGKERIAAIQVLTKRLAVLYDAEDIAIGFENEDNGLSGYYAPDAKMIVLNIRALFTNNYDITKDFLDTVFHEFRHVAQRKMVKSQKYVWYNDEDKVLRIARNLYPPANYISPEENLIRYHNQYVEVDAREIARYILEE